MTDRNQRNPTVLDYAILGLIQNEPLSGYQIRKEFETTALGNYSSSPGTIYPALKRLQGLGLIVQLTSNNKQKFHGTPAGKAVLKDWFLQPIEKKDITHRLNELLLRFGFMDDMLTIEQKLEFLLSMQKQIKNYLDELHDYYQNPVFQDIHLQGKLAFEHGLESYKSTLKWCRKSISILKNIE